MSIIGEAGEIVVQGSVAGDDEPLGGSRIDPDKLGGLIEGAGRYATGVWQRIDPRGQPISTATSTPQA